MVTEQDLQQERETYFQEKEVELCEKKKKAARYKRIKDYYEDKRLMSDTVKEVWDEENEIY